MRAELDAQFMCLSADSALDCGQAGVQLERLSNCLASLDPQIIDLEVERGQGGLDLERLGECLARLCVEMIIYQR